MTRAPRTRARPARAAVKDDPASAYDMTEVAEEIESRTLACIVDNEPGVLARVVGLFSARGYNIESLTVAETDRNAHSSRITIVTSGTDHVLEQIEQQLLRLVPVARVIDVTNSTGGIERELALVKVAGVGEKRVEALRLSEIFRARVIDTTNESFIFEVTGASQKIDQFIELMRPLGLVELSRTGVLSIQRGKEGVG
ncbi:acetolactate synthase small subunit [bacterium]|nr:acetolactate synthase small subunit [bacterium]